MFKKRKENFQGENVVKLAGATRHCYQQMADELRRLTRLLNAVVDCLLTHPMSRMIRWWANPSMPWFPEGRKKAPNCPRLLRNFRGIPGKLRPLSKHKSWT